MQNKKPTRAFSAHLPPPSRQLPPVLNSLSSHRKSTKSSRLTFPSFFLSPLSLQRRVSSSQSRDRRKVGPYPQSQAETSLGERAYSQRSLHFLALLLHLGAVACALVHGYAVVLDSQEHGTLHTQTPAATAAVCSRARAARPFKAGCGAGGDPEASAPPLEGADWLVTDGTRAGPRGPAAVTAAAEGSGSQGADDVGAAASCAHKRGGGGRGRSGDAARSLGWPPPWRGPEFVTLP